MGLIACGADCREVLRKRTEGPGWVGGTEVARPALLKRRLYLTFVSIWVPAPESNPSDVKGEGTRKNNMEITWTVRAPAPPLEGLSRAAGSPCLLHPRPQGDSDYWAGLLATPLCVGHPETKQEQDVRRERGVEGPEECRPAVWPES